MTIEQRHERASAFAMAEAPKLLKRLGLEGWQVTWIFVQSESVEECEVSGNVMLVWARVIPDLAHHEITVTLATLRPLAEIRKTLCHEFMHVLLEPMWRFVQRMIGRTPKTQQVVLQGEFQELYEQAVSDVTRAAR